MANRGGLAETKKPLNETANASNFNVSSDSKLETCCFISRAGRKIAIRSNIKIINFFPILSWNVWFANCIRRIEKRKKNKIFIFTPYTQELYSRVLNECGSFEKRESPQEFVNDNSIAEFV